MNADAMLDEPTQPQEVPEVDMAPIMEDREEAAAVTGPSAPAKPRTITKRRRR